MTGKHTETPIDRELVERLTEIAYRDTAQSVTVRADDLRAALSALSVLTEALAERERDAARLDWLEHNCVNVADDLGTGSQLYLGTYATAPLRQAIDAAMKDPDHAR